MRNVIEFYGLSGCGKTTTSEHLISLLRAKGYTVGTQDDFIHSRLSYSKKYKYFLYLIYVILSLTKPGNIKLFHVFFKISNDDSITKKIKRSLYAYRFYIAYIKKNKYDYIVLEQGFIQAIISLFHTESEFDESLLQIIKEVMTKKSICVYCEADTDIVIRRITGRKTTGGRFDLYTDCENLYRDLEILQRNFAIIDNQLSIDLMCYIKLNMEISAECNAEIVMYQISKGDCKD